MMYVSSSGLSGKSLESCALGLFNSVLSSRALIHVAEPSGMETRQRVSWSAVMSSNAGVCFPLISSLSPAMLLVGEILISKALDDGSPSTRQNKVTRLSAMVL